MTWLNFWLRWPLIAIMITLVFMHYYLAIGACFVMIASRHIAEDIREIEKNEELKAYKEAKEVK